MLAFRMEPTIVYLLQFACLFQAGILVVNDINKVFVVTDDSQFSGRDVYLIEGYAVILVAGNRRICPE